MRITLLLFVHACLAVTHIKYGSVIQLFHSESEKLLYSHTFNYFHEGSSGQQQVVAVEFRDSSGYWKVLPPFGVSMEQVEGQVVKNFDLFRLQHKNSGKFLHSHDIPAPVTKTNFEVSGFGQFGEGGDENDNFRLEIVPNGGDVWEGDRRVSLIHAKSARMLWSKSGVQHENYTANQQEVSCWGPADKPDVDWWTAVPIDLSACTADGRCDRLIDKPTEYRIVYFEGFNDDRFRDHNKDPDNGPKEITIFCPQNPMVNVYDLDLNSQEDGNCFVLNLSAPNFDTRLVLQCGKNKTKPDY